jgi:hypothetical protein
VIEAADWTRKLVSMTVSYMNEHGLTRNIAPSAVTSICLQLNDLTEQERREEAIIAEEMKIRGMLQRMIPEQIVTQLSEGPTASLSRSSRR